MRAIAEGVVAPSAGDAGEIVADIGRLRNRGLRPGEPVQAVVAVVPLAHDGVECGEQVAIGIITAGQRHDIAVNRAGLVDAAVHVGVGRREGSAREVRRVPGDGFGRLPVGRGGWGLADFVCGAWSRYLRSPVPKGEGPVAPSP